MSEVGEGYCNWIQSVLKNKYELCFVRVNATEAGKPSSHKNANYCYQSNWIIEIGRNNQNERHHFILNSL